MPKNPGTEFSMLGMALDETLEVLNRRNLKMPQHLIIEAGAAVTSEELLFPVVLPLLPLVRPTTA